MKRNLFEKAALALVALLFVVNVYRAATQSCTVDEAITYNEYASKSVMAILTLPYDANNQVLHSILCRWAVRTLGVSELTLRIPSLLGGLLFFAMSYRLCRLYFGNRWLFLVTLSALALNPFTLDYLSVARGYGLAAGFFLVACLELSLHLLEPAWNARRLVRASFALGLAVMANLTFAIPAVAVVLVFLHLEMWELRRLRFWDSVNQLILPGFVAAAAVLLLPMIRASPGVFYFGAKTIKDCIASLTLPALVHHSTPLVGFGRWLNHGAGWLLAVGGVAILIGLFAATARFRAEPVRARYGLMLFGGTLALSCAMLVSAHASIGMQYPYARTGLYLAVLFNLALGSLAMWAGETGTRVLCALAAPVLLLFAVQINAGPYHTWIFDSGTKAIVKRMRDDMAKTPARKIQIASEELLAPSLNFYRRRYHLNQVARVEGGSVKAAADDANYADYYVVSGSNEALVERRHLRILYRDPISGQILAKPAAR